MKDEYIQIPDPVGFSRRLHRLRAEAMLTTGAVADSIGCSRQSVSSYESRRCGKISSGTLYQISKVFGVSVDYLLTGDGSEMPEPPPDFCCKYNSGVGCYSQHCDNCGWNPDVECKRKEAIHHAQAEKLLREAWYYNG